MTCHINPATLAREIIYSNSNNQSTLCMAKCSSLHPCGMGLIETYEFNNEKKCLNTFVHIVISF